MISIAQMENNNNNEELPGYHKSALIRAHIINTSISKRTKEMMDIEEKGGKIIKCSPCGGNYIGSLSTFSQTNNCDNLNVVGDKHFIDCIIPADNVIRVRDLTTGTERIVRFDEQRPSDIIEKSSNIVDLTNENNGQQNEKSFSLTKEELKKVGKIARAKFIKDRFKTQVNLIFSRMLDSAVKMERCYQEVEFEIPEDLNPDNVENIMVDYFTDLGYNVSVEPRKLSSNKIKLTLS